MGGAGAAVVVLVDGEDGACVVVVVVVVVTSVSFLGISWTLSERTQEQQVASMAHSKNGKENFRNLMMGAVVGSTSPHGDLEIY